MYNVKLSFQVISFLNIFFIFQFMISIKPYKVKSKNNKYWVLEKKYSGKSMGTIYQLIIYL